MSSILFSIIIPSYNRAYILKRTLASVLNQTYTHFECIVVDDGSTDNTKELLSSYTDRRLRYVYQHNAERSAARNNGIQHAQGEYICFLDSDDEYLPKHLETLHNAIQAAERKVALFFTHAEQCADGNCQQNPPALLADYNTIDYLLTFPIIPARVCISAEILKTIRFREDIVIVEDQVLWTTIALHFPIIQVEQCTVRYHLHDDNSVHWRKNCFTPRLHGLEKFFAQTDASIIPTALKNIVLSNCHFGIARYYLHYARYWLMRKHLILSVVKKPCHAQTKAKLHMIVFPQKHLQ